MKIAKLLTITALCAATAMTPLLAADPSPAAASGAQKMNMNEMMKDKKMMRQMCTEMCKDPAMMKMMCDEMMKNPEGMKMMCQEMAKSPEGRKMCMEMMKTPEK